MNLGRLKIGLILLLSLSGFAISVPLALGKKKDKHPTANPQMDEQKQAVHALNRLTFGPRPGDVDHVLAIGVDKWIDQQLHPEKINDDAHSMPVSLHFAPCAWTRVRLFRTFRPSK